MNEKVEIKREKNERKLSICARIWKKNKVQIERYNG